MSAHPRSESMTDQRMDLPKSDLVSPESIGITYMSMWVMTHEGCVSGALGSALRQLHQSLLSPSMVIVYLGEETCKSGNSLSF